MTDDLPSRGFTPLPPPPDGALTAVRGGRGIRRRRRLAGAGAAAASLVLVAGVVAASGAGSTHAEDQLVPADRLTRTPEAPPPALIDGRAPAPARPAGAAPGTHPGDASGTTAEGSGTTTGQTSQGSGTGSGGSSTYRTPALRRTYQPGSGPSVPTTQQGPTARVCGGQVYDDQRGFSSSSNWCMAAIVTSTSRGHDLTVQLCRDSTGSGRLTFTRTREVELVVRSASRTVWRWSTGQPDAENRHTLDAGADGCWRWTAPWTDVDARGKDLPEGSYTLVVTGAAAEVTALGPQQTAFQVH